jgi:hypothetical protein
MRLFIVGAALLLATVLPPRLAGAQAEQSTDQSADQPADLSRCTMTNGAPVEDRLAACTAVIEAGQEPLKDLAAARFFAAPSI